MSSLVKYDAACHALAEARAVDEVKDIRDKADAMRIYAMQAKNKSLEIDAAEIRIRAERRLGEMIAAQKAAGALNRGARMEGTTDGKSSVVVTDDRREKPTLGDAGISKDLSSRAQKLAAVPEKEFESEVATWRERVKQEGHRVTTRLEKAGEREQAKHAQEDADAFDGVTLEDEIAQLQRENERLQARIKALTSDDQAKTLDTEIKARQGIEARLGQEMDRSSRLDRELRGYGKFLADLRKILRVDGGRREILVAVASLTRQAA